MQIDLPYPPSSNRCNYGESPAVIPDQPGVYIILNKVNQHIYVGSTVKLRRRWYQHSWSLDNNSHHNPHLQNAWNKYGNHNFCFIALEIVASNDMILPTEQRWIDAIDAANRTDCYNFCAKAGSHLGRKRSEETRRRLSIANIGKKASPEARQKQRLAKLGKKQDPEVAKRNGDARRGKPVNRPSGIINHNLRKFTPEQVREIRRKKAEGVSYSTLCAEYGSSVGPIQRIVNREAYKDIV